MKHFNPSMLAEGGVATAPMRFGAAGGGYDATISKGKRKVVTARSRSEDAELNNNERLILSGNTRDIRRNFAVAAWMIRRHLDYVSSFSFQSRTGDTKVDDQIEKLVRTWARARNFDAGRRHSMRRMLRLTEALRTIDGDNLVLFRRDGRVQLVEGDRIRNPISGASTNSGLAPEDMQNVINGVLLDPSSGAARGYCVHKRDRTGMTLSFDRLVPTPFSYLHGYFDRYDQVRGISPIAAAVNSFRDLYESFDYALVKGKIAQLLALAVMRQGGDQLGNVDAETETDDQGNQKTKYDIDLGRGPVMFDLDPGDEIKVLESSQPSTQSQAFWQMTIMIALKSLDIPYCFFDESHTNYSGLRVAWIQYDQAAEPKREDNRELLNWLTYSRIRLAILNDELILPGSMMIDDVDFDWISRGVPWVDQSKEVLANIAAIRAGLDDPQSIIKSQGRDPFDVIDKIKEFNDYAKEAGVQLALDTSSAAAAAAAPGTSQDDSEQQPGGDSEQQPGATGDAGKSGSSE